MSRPLCIIFYGIFQNLFYFYVLDWFTFFFSRMELNSILVKEGLLLNEVYLFFDIVKFYLEG